MPRVALPGVLLASALTLPLGGCKSDAEKASERLMPAVEALVATVPTADPKALVRTVPGYDDTLTKLEAALRDGPHPPAGTPAAQKLAPAQQWAAAARAEITTLEAAFQKALSGVEQTAHGDLALAVGGAPTKDASEIPDALARSQVKPILLWHGAGSERRFDEDHQLLPPDRRAVDPEGRFIVGYVQRSASDGIRFVDERVVAEQRVAIVALYVMPSRWRLGVFTVKGDVARLPNPVPPPGTTLPGSKPPLVESLLRANPHREP